MTAVDFGPFHGATCEIWPLARCSILARAFALYGLLWYSFCSMVGLFLRIQFPRGLCLYPSASERMNSKCVCMGGVAKNPSVA